MSHVAPTQVEILFRIEDEQGNEYTECIAGLERGEERYELAGGPVRAYGVSLGDLVLALQDEDEARPAFHRVLRKSGNRTVRVAFDLAVAPGNASEEILQELRNLGCSHDAADAHFVVVTVPRAVSLEAVAACLAENEARWEHADPTYAEVHPDEA
jgi:hypothetical protein